MIVDFAMPGINGAEVARAAPERSSRSLDHFCQRVFRDRRHPERAEEKALLLHKPFRVDDLQSALQSLLTGS